MLRLRSTRLLSGVSAIAIIAGVGMLNSASADPVYSGPLVTPPITNNQSGNGATVVIHDNATVDKNPGTNASNDAPDTAADSFFNNLTMTGAGNKLRVSNSYLLGDIENVGVMQSSDANGILINYNSQIGGRVFNSGLLEGSGAYNAGLYLTQDSTITGGIANTGTIRNNSAYGDGITIGRDSEVFAGIFNSGTIVGGSDGIDFNERHVEFRGGITNASTGTILSLNAGSNWGNAAIEWGGHLFGGGINNAGTILGQGYADGFHMQRGTFEDGITNTGLIAGRNGIRITKGYFSGGITNDVGGTIQGNGGRAAIWFRGKDGATFDGGITNNAFIHGIDGANGIRISRGTFSGGITNNQYATIRAEGDASAIVIRGGTFYDGIENSGLIDNVGTNGAAISIRGYNDFFGGITNNSTGTISGGDTGIYIANKNFSGGISNAGLIASRGTTEDAIHITGYDNTFSGGINNTGIIDGARNGIYWNGDLFNFGSIVNDGTIYGRTNDGIRLRGNYFDGDVVNNQTIIASDNGIYVGPWTTVTGSIVNNGLIDPQNGMLIKGHVLGSISNPGTIEATSNGIKLAYGGKVDGGITNSGTIVAGYNAINLVGEGSATSIHQTGGLIQGNKYWFDGKGGVTTALMLDQYGYEYVDTFTGSAGKLDGDTVGGGWDDFIVDTSTKFAYLRGTASGLDDFNMTGSGDFIMGAKRRGDKWGEGIYVTANNMYFTGKGRVYVDDNTTVDLYNSYHQTDPYSILEFYLTGNTYVHGQINAWGDGLYLDGKIAAFINGRSIAAVGGDTFTYDNVMTGETHGTFTNAGNIITNRLFFTGEAIVNPYDVDIILHRQSFVSDAIFYNGLTHNEFSVGNALDELYELGPGMGGYGYDMQKLFGYLFKLGPYDQDDALFVYNELSGAEHAQMQQVALNILNPFNTFLGLRMDESRSLTGAGTLANLRQRYAMAAGTMTDVNRGVVRGPSGMSVWARGYGQWSNVDGDNEAPGYDTDSGGVYGGIDFTPDPFGLLGLAIGWSNQDVDFDTFRDKGSVDSFQLAAYGSYLFDPRWYVDGTIGGAWHDIDTSRYLDLPGGAGGPVTANASYNGDSFFVSGEIGGLFHGDMWVDDNVWLLQPSLGLIYVDLNTDNFRETGAGGFSLVVDGADASSFASLLGGRAASLYMWDGTPILPEFSLYWRHEFDDSRQSIVAAFPDNLLGAFPIISSDISDDSAVVGASVTAGLDQNFEMFLSYNGLFNSEVSVNNASLGVRGTW